MGQRVRRPRKSHRDAQLALVVQKKENPMATIKQIEANRRNARKSTGPKTPAGKASVKLNGLRHGLRARTVILPGENAGDFHQLCDDLEAEWRPQSRTEHFYLEQMAISQWKLTRIELAEERIALEACPTQIQLPLLDRLWQSKCRLERSYARAQRELQRLQKSRRPADPPDEADSANPPPWESVTVTWVDPEDPDGVPPFPMIVGGVESHEPPSTG